MRDVVERMLVRLNGKKFGSVKELRTRIADLNWKYRQHLPNDFGISQMMQIIKRNSLYHKNKKTGIITIIVLKDKVIDQANLDYSQHGR